MARSLPPALVPLDLCIRSSMLLRLHAEALHTDNHGGLDLDSLVRQLKPEEEELLRKREELAAVRAVLADRELELIDLQSSLAAFEGFYLRQVGILYAELDGWRAKIAELRARLDPSEALQADAAQARDQARQTHAQASSEASVAREFTPSPELKSLYKESAKRIHPDFAIDAADLERRTRYMAAANYAYKAGDAAALRSILQEYESGADAIVGEGIGAELIRVIRQISLANARILAIAQQLAALRGSEIALLKRQAEDREQEGGNLLQELAVAIREQINLVKREYEALAEQEDRTV